MTRLNKRVMLNHVFKIVLIKEIVCVLQPSYLRVHSVITLRKTFKEKASLHLLEILIYRFDSITFTIC